MSEIVGIAEAKNDLSELINRAAYGGERIVLGSRGKPKAAIVGMADLQRLEMLEKGQPQQPTINVIQIVKMSDAGRQARDGRAILADAATLRGQIAAERAGQPLPDSVEELRAIRLDRARP